MRSDRTALALLIALGGCGGPSGGSSTERATVARSTSPAAASAPTSEPVHIETNSSGDKYITVVQRVAEAGRRERIAYALRALSSEAEIVGAGSVATFEQPHVTFFDRVGKQLVADSPQAKITQRDKSVFMSGGVHARAADGSVLTCDTLRYDGGTGKLHGRGHVVLTGPNGLTLTGNYLMGDVRLDDVRVTASPL